MASGLKGKKILITGGTGSFGRAFTRHLLKLHNPKTIRIFSRDEFKQYQMQLEFADKRLRFLLGDVRDEKRLKRAMESVDVVVHAAALKHIAAAEYNPFEPVKTNILGSKNVIEAALDAGVRKVLLISSDKAAHPINLYGATKLCAEKLFVQGNVFKGKSKSAFSVVRYGNVLGSRGSVVPLFYKQKSTGTLTITDKAMTRFWITLEQASNFVTQSLGRMKGGEIFIPKLPSIKIVNLAKAVSSRAKLKIVGIRPGEKLHEELITNEESRRVKEYKYFYIIQPEFSFWKPLSKKSGRPRKSFSYRSDGNKVWLSRPQIGKLLKNFPNE